MDSCPHCSPLGTEDVKYISKDDVRQCGWDAIASYTGYPLLTFQTHFWDASARGKGNPHLKNPTSLQILARLWLETDILMTMEVNLVKLCKMACVKYFSFSSFFTQALLSKLLWISTISNFWDWPIYHLCFIDTRYGGKQAFFQPLARWCCAYFALSYVHTVLPSKPFVESLLLSIKHKKSLVIVENDSHHIIFYQW